MPSNLAQCQQGPLLVPGVEWLSMLVMLPGQWLMVRASCSIPRPVGPA
jgi:hypothetical protein